MKSIFVTALMFTGLVTGLFTAAFSHADTDQNQQSSKQAYALKQLLAEVDTLQGEFEQIIFENDQQIEQLTGHFKLGRPAQLYWATDTPDETLLLADGNNIWFYNPFVEQVTVFDQGDAMQANPLLLLVDSRDNVWSEFDVEKQSDYWIIRNTAEQSEVHELRLKFFNNQLNEMIVDDGQGQVSVFSFMDLVQNEPIDSRWFVPDFPEDVMIDDQR